MATTKQQQNTTTDMAAIEVAATDTPTITAPTASPQAQAQAQAVDFSASDTWGQGGRFVIDAQGQRVPAPAN